LHMKNHKSLYVHVHSHAVLKIIQFWRRRNN
jgi:hypothetical protein